MYGLNKDEPALLTAINAQSVLIGSVLFNRVLIGCCEYFVSAYETQSLVVLNITH